MDTVELDNSAEIRWMEINIKNSTWCSLYRCTWNFQGDTDLMAFILGSSSKYLTTTLFIYNIKLSDDSEWWTKKDVDGSNNELHVWRCLNAASQASRKLRKSITIICLQLKYEFWIFWMWNSSGNYSASYVRCEVLW
jgi:hypothetical protein